MSSSTFLPHIAATLSVTSLIKLDSHIVIELQRDMHRTWHFSSIAKSGGGTNMSIYSIFIADRNLFLTFLRLYCTSCTVYSDSRFWLYRRIQLRRPDYSSS